MALDFLLNLPIGLLGFILGRNIMPDIKGSNTSLDFKGYLIFSAAACLLLLSAESLSHALPPYIPYACWVWVCCLHTVI